MPEVWALILPDRKDEIAAIAAILDSGDYEDSTELAKAVLHKAADLFALRDTHGVAYGLQTDSIWLHMGPYYDVRDANKAAAELQALGMRTATGRILSPVMPEHEEPAANHCANCGHAPQLHNFQGCGIYLNKSKERCPCKTSRR